MGAPGEGDVIGGKYRLDRRLGEGGMGVVWAATHLVTHKAIALKLLHRKSDDPAARKRAIREARAACAVSHPNVVTVHDVLEGDDGTPILVMDLLRGESLADRLAREKTLPAADALAIARDVLSALEAAHAVGVVHRDLKPDNVFLCEGGPVKILDFGVAKLKGTDAATKETNRLTETGAMIGTPHYMAPEQAFGESDVDLRADLWAVGAVLYECIAAVPPTNGTNLGQILKALAKGEITPLRERVPNAPSDVCAIVDRLLSIDRAARPSCAKDVIVSIDAVKDAPRAKLDVAASSLAERADTPPPATRTTAGAPRRSRGLFAAVAVAIAVGGLATIGWKTMTRMRDAVVTREPPASATATATASATATATATATAAESAARIAKRAPPRASTTTAATKPPSSAAGPLLTNPPF